MAETEQTYDFIVTGAGSAGCAVAGAAVANPAATACCCWKPAAATAIPGSTSRSATPRPTPIRAVNWMFESEPEPQLNSRTLYQPRGKVLGGTSSINGMVYMRGNPADYDGWRQRGCEGWDCDSVLPYFKQGRGPGARRRRVPRRRRPAQGLRPAGDAATLADAMHRGGVAGRHPAQPRLQRRAAGRRRLLPDDHQQRAGAGARRGLSEAGAQARTNLDRRAPTRTRRAS